MTKEASSQCQGRTLLGDVGKDLRQIRMFPIDVRIIPAVLAC